jgi:hypothetical protein
LEFSGCSLEDESRQYLSYSRMYFATKASKWNMTLLPALHLCS